MIPAIIFLCAQTELEKQATIIGVCLLLVLLLVFVIDSVSKNAIIPKKNHNLKLFVAFLFVVVFIALILLLIYYI